MPGSSIISSFSPCLLFKIGFVNPLFDRESLLLLLLLNFCSIILHMGTKILCPSKGSLVVSFLAFCVALVLFPPFFLLWKANIPKKVKLFAW